MWILDPYPAAIQIWLIEAIEKGWSPVRNEELRSFLNAALGPHAVTCNHAMQYGEKRGVLLRSITLVTAGGRVKSPGYHVDRLWQPPDSPTDTAVTRGLINGHIHLDFSGYQP
jgi:hypothetical protein